MLTIESILKCRVLMADDGSLPQNADVLNLEAHKDEDWVFTIEFESSLLGAADKACSLMFDDDWAMQDTSWQVQVLHNNEWIALGTAMAHAIIELGEEHGFSIERDNDEQIVLYTGYKYDGPTKLVPINPQPDAT